MNENGLIAFFGTNDLEKNKLFYNKIMNFDIYKDQGLCLIYEVPGGGKIGFCEHMEVTAKNKSPIITIVVNDVDEIFNKLTNNKVFIESIPSINEKFKIYHFFLTDNDGYTVEIQKFL